MRHILLIAAIAHASPALARSAERYIVRFGVREVTWNAKSKVQSDLFSADLEVEAGSGEKFELTNVNDGVRQSLSGMLTIRDDGNAEVKYEFLHVRETGSQFESSGVLSSDSSTKARFKGSAQWWPNREDRATTRHCFFFDAVTKSTETNGPSEEGTDAFSSRCTKLADAKLREVQMEYEDRVRAAGEIVTCAKKTMSDRKAIRAGCNLLNTVRNVYDDTPAADVAREVLRQLANNAGDDGNVEQDDKEVAGAELLAIAKTLLYEKKALGPCRNVLHTISREYGETAAGVEATHLLERTQGLKLSR